MIFVFVLCYSPLPWRGGGGWGAHLPSFGGVGGGLLLVPQYRVTVLTGANAPRVYHVAHEDAAVAYLARVGYLQNHLYRGVEEYVATNDGDGHALDDIGTVLDATIDALLTALADAMHVVVLKPVDVG